MLFVLALLFLQIAGNAADGTRRIYNGFLAADDEFKSTVAILAKVGATLRYQCAGVVVGERTVVTARHCVNCESFRNKFAVISKSRNLKTGEQHDVLDVVCAEKNRAVAVLLVDGPFGEDVPPLNIAEDMNFGLAAIGKCVVAGWGQLYETLHLQEIHPPQPNKSEHVGPYTVDCKVCDLHHGVVQMIPRGRCRTKLRKFRGEGLAIRKDRSQVCTLPVNTQDTCVGDAGAPIFCNTLFYGMVYESHPTLPCGTPDVPDIVHWMPFFKEWVEESVDTWEKNKTFVRE